MVTPITPGLPFSFTWYQAVLSWLAKLTSSVIAALVWISRALERLPSGPLLASASKLVSAPVLAAGLGPQPSVAQKAKGRAKERAVLIIARAVYFKLRTTRLFLPVGLP